MYGLTLDWERCPDGVELVPAPDPAEWHEQKLVWTADRFRKKEAEPEWLSRKAEFLKIARAKDGIFEEAKEYVEWRATQGAAISIDDYIEARARSIWNREITERQIDDLYFNKAREYLSNFPERPPQARFKYRSQRKVPVRHDLSSLDDPIALHFVNARSGSAMTCFLDRFGLPVSRSGYRPNPAISLDVVFVEALRQDIEELLGEAGGGDKIAAIDAVNRALDSATSGQPPSYARRFLITPTLDLPPGSQTPRLALRPGSLFALMVLEAAMVAANGARLTACEHCEKAFLTGPLTGRRAHAKYCSDRCRVAAMRKRNAERTSEGK